MPPDIWHLKWSGSHATVVSEKEEWTNCDMNLPACSSGCVGRLSTWYWKRHKEAKKHLLLKVCNCICIIVGTDLLLGSVLSLSAMLTPFQNLWSRWEKSELGAAAETLLVCSGLLTHVELQVCLWGYCLKSCCPQNSEWTWNWNSCDRILAADRATESNNCSMICSAEML